MDPPKSKKKSLITCGIATYTTMYSFNFALLSNERTSMLELLETFLIIILGFLKERNQFYIRKIATKHCTQNYQFHIIYVMTIHEICTVFVLSRKINVLMSIQINRVIDFAQDKVKTLMSLPFAQDYQKSFR